MIVTGYLSLYTTLLGWQQYQSLWEIACGAGLIYLPFMGMILRQTFQPFSTLNSTDASLTAIKSLLLNLVTALLIIAFAAKPLISLDPQVLHVEVLCKETPGETTPGHTQTTYDQAFPIPTGVKVPLFWYAVMTVSNGITHAASVTLPCSPIDYRALHTQLETAQIEDPKLKQAVTQFYRDCYLPAYSTYLTKQTQEGSLHQPNTEDIGWLGSQTFLNGSELYDTHQATQSVSGFAFNPLRDVESNQLDHPPQNGNPTCKEWWEDPTHGLHTQLKHALPPTFWQKITSIDGDKKSLEDAAIKTLLTHNLTHQSLSDQLRGYESLNNNVSADYLSRFIGAPLGVGYESLSFYPKLHLLMNALPMIQGALLFALYAFLALGVIFSSYRIQFCITGAIMIFSVIFCSFLWHVVQWFDHILIEALYPTFDNFIVKNLQSFNPNQILVDMIIGTLYVVLPLIWLMVMGWAGFRAGYEIGGLIGGMSAPAYQSGQHLNQSVRKFLP